MRSRWASGAERRAVRRRPRRSCWRSARPRAGSPGPARVWAVRSGERRGGEEGRFRWAPGHLKKKKGVTAGADRSRGASATALHRRAQLVILLDHTSEFALYLVQARVDLLLIVAAPADPALF